jgi:hypothetical protein
LLGTNDSQPQNWEHTEALAGDLSSLIDTFATITEHRQTWVCLPLPAFSTTFEISDSIIQNGIIPIIDSVAQARGLPRIDCYAPFLDHADYYNSDGIHLNADGLAFLATIIYNRMYGQTAVTYHRPIVMNSDNALRKPGTADCYDVTGRTVVPGNTRNGVYLMYDRKNDLIKKIMVIKQE